MTTGLILQYIAIAAIAVALIIVIIFRIKKMHTKSSSGIYCSNCSIQCNCRKKDNPDTKKCHSHIAKSK